MMRLDYTLVADSRVSVGNGPAVVNDRPVQQQIPGSTLRGALAAAYARDFAMSWSDPTSDFMAGFERDVRYGAATPCGWNVRQLSHVSCKYPSQECDPGLRDLALDVLLDRQVDLACPTCRGTWRVGKAELAADGAAGLGSGLLVTTTRTALTPDGVAVTGQLFTRRALRAGIEFAGRLILADDTPADVVEWLRQSRRIRIGGQRGVLGAMTWKVLDQPPDDTTENSLPLGRSHCAVLRCLAPVIVVDEFGAPTLDLGQTLAEVLGSATITAQWARPVKVSGWHAASGLPKPEEWAISTGSTFVLADLPVDAAARLAIGLGLRTVEGFGQVELYDGRAGLEQDSGQTSQPCLKEEDPSEPQRSASPTPRPRLPGGGPVPGPPPGPLPRQPTHPATRVDPALDHGRRIGARLDRKSLAMVSDNLRAIGKKRSSGRAGDADRTASALVELPRLRNQLDADAMASLAWSATEASSEEIQRVLNGMGGVN